jgi:hypothetical protein
MSGPGTSPRPGSWETLTYSTMLLLSPPTHETSFCAVSTVHKWSNILRSNDNNSSYTSTDLFQFPLTSVSKYRYKLHCLLPRLTSKPCNQTPNYTNLYCDILKLLSTILQYEHHWFSTKKKLTITLKLVPSKHITFLSNQHVYIIY